MSKRCMTVSIGAMHLSFARNDDKYEDSNLAKMAFA